MPNRLLRRRWGKPDDVMSLIVAQEIVEAYGKLLETCGDAIGIRDASGLPYPKQDIKRALRAVLRAPAHQLLQSILRRSYVLLANWQDGYDQPEETGAVVNVADECSDAIAQSCPDIGQDDWQAKVEAERVVLRRELQRL